MEKVKQPITARYVHGLTTIQLIILLFYYETLSLFSHNWFFLQLDCDKLLMKESKNMMSPNEQPKKNHDYRRYGRIRHVRSRTGIQTKYKYLYLWRSGMRPFVIYDILISDP